MQTKGIIRSQILQKLRNQKPEERNRKSCIIREKLFSLKEFKKSKNIMCYISLDTEADTREIIKDALKLKKRVFAPVVEGERLGIAELKEMDADLERSPLGVLQPKKHSFSHFPPDRLDLAIVPGLAFDKKGNRLGRGKAYFDRFLKDLPETVKTVGLAFNFQILKSIPTNSRDIPIDLVIND